MSLHEDRIEKTLGSVTGDYDGQIPEPQSRIEVLLQKILENGGGSGSRRVPGIILNESQYDIHGVPIIDNPIEDVYYMVPNTDSEQGGYIIYMYVDEEWVNIGTTYEQDETIIERVDDLEDKMAQIEPGLSDEAKSALLNLVRHVAYIDDQGQDYYDTLEEALYEQSSKTLSSISATYDPGQNEIYVTDPLNKLREYLSVIANYTDGTNALVSRYNLSGELVVGTSTITVTYEDKSTQFTATVIDNLLYNWDFTQSLVDSVQNQEAYLGTGEAWEIPGKSKGTTAPVRGSTGIVFNDAQQFARLLPTSMEMTSWLRNKTVQIDVASFSPALDTDNDPYVPGIVVADIDCSHIRLLITANHYSLGPNGDIDDEYFHMETGIAYGINADGQDGTYPKLRDFDNKGWGIVAKKLRVGYADPDTTDTTSIGTATKKPFSEIRSAVDAISGHTVSVYINNAGNWRMYIDNSMFGMAKEAIDYDIYGLQIGAGGRPFYGGCFYNALITGARIYKGNIFDTTDRIMAGFCAFPELVYTDMNLNDIKQYLTVAYVHNGVDTILQDSEYTLSGTLAEGMNTISITYRNLTTTVAVRAWQKVNTLSVTDGQIFKTSGSIYNKAVSGIGTTMVIDHGYDGVQLSIYTNQGVKSVLTVNGASTSIYPIPIPSNAVKVVLSDLKPLYNFHGNIGLWRYDSSTNMYTFIEDTGWCQSDSCVYSLPTTGNNLYLTVKIKHKDTGTTPIPVELTDCKLVFVRGGE